MTGPFPFADVAILAAIWLVAFVGLLGLFGLVSAVWHSRDDVWRLARDRRRRLVAGGTVTWAPDTVTEGQRMRADTWSSDEAGAARAARDGDVGPDLRDEWDDCNEWDVCYGGCDEDGAA